MRKRLQKESDPPTSPKSPIQPTSYPPFKLGGGSFSDAEVPRGQNESRGLGQGHGADSRGIHTEGGFRNVCRGSQLHIPHSLQTGRKTGQMRQSTVLFLLRQQQAPVCLLGPRLWVSQGAGAPLGQGPPGAPLGTRASLSSARKADRVRPSWSQTPAPRAMPRPLQNPMENFQERGSWGKNRETTQSSEFWQYVSKVSIYKSLTLQNQHLP